jgi:formylglycine-generating enzyme required for sulfatase activity
MFAHPAGQKPANTWGLRDMHGNVWEWCLDTYKPEPGKPLPPNADKYKIFKGGGWNQDAEYARASSRFMMSPSTGIHFVGFRIVLAQKQNAGSP